MIFHCFLTDDLPSYVLQDHQKCAKHQGISVEYRFFPATDDYDKIYKAHGDFLNEKLEKAAIDETVCFIDIDALPWDGAMLNQIFRWTDQNKTFTGNAQNISHTRLRNEIYAAASLLMINKSAYKALGSPDLAWGVSEQGDQIDTAQNLTRQANLLGHKYRLLYPLGFDDADKCYDLAGYGLYGTGTTYPGTWHYFRISALKDKSSPPALWSRRVNDILRDHPMTPLMGSPYFLSNQNKSWAKIKKFFF